MMNHLLRFTLKAGQEPFRTFLFYTLLLLALLFAGCGMPGALKGGKSAHGQHQWMLEQGENAAGPSSLEHAQEFERSFIVPRDSEITSWTIDAPAAPDSAPRTNFSSIRVSEPVVITEKRSSGAKSTLGAAQKDEARTLSARISAMKPVQWVGISLCVGSIAAFYFGWPTIGFLALAVGGGMIITAAVVPGREGLILCVGAVGFILVALGVAYAYSKGKLDGNKNGIPDFLEK